MILSVTTKRTHTSVHNEFAGRETTMVLFNTITFVRQCAVVGPRPAAGLTILAQIEKGAWLDDPFLYRFIVHDHDKLLDIASIKGNAVLPRTFLVTPVHC
jgi:hypothetical protein